MSCKRQLPAIANVAFRLTFILPQQSRGKIQPFDVSESQSMQGVQPIPATAGKFHDLTVSGYLFSPQLHQALGEFLDLLFWSFKREVGRLPNIFTNWRLNPGLRLQSAR